MKNYAVSQSFEEINFAYSRLINMLQDHVSLLSKEGLPFSSVIGHLRSLRRLKLDYSDLTTDKVIKPNKISQNELLLADRVHRTFGKDVVPALEISLFGEKEMKRALILHSYDMMLKQGLRGKDIKKKLSEEYDVSVSAIEKWFYRRAHLHSDQSGKKENGGAIKLKSDLKV